MSNEASLFLKIASKKNKRRVTANTPAFSANPPYDRLNVSASLRFFRSVPSETTETFSSEGLLIDQISGHCFGGNQLIMDLC